MSLDTFRQQVSNSNLFLLLMCKYKILRSLHSTDILMITCVFLLMLLDADMVYKK